MTIQSFSQTVTVPLLDSIYSGNDTAKLDLNNNSVDDISIYRYVEVDAYYYNGVSIGTNIKMTSPKSAGQSFDNFTEPVSVIQSSIGCNWTSWLPNTGERYLGYYILNAVNDTTFGYITMEFKGNWCSDTLFIYSYTYSTIPNTHLTPPGQTSFQCPITFTVNTIDASCSSCCDGSATVTNIANGCSPYYILWSPGGGNSTTVNNLCAGTIWLSISDTGCCPSVQQSFSIGVMTSIKTTQSVKVKMTYSREIKSLSFHNSPNLSSVQVISSNGQLLKSLSIADNEIINLADLSAGFYIVCLYSNGQIIMKEKLIIN